MNVETRHLLILLALTLISRLLLLGESPFEVDSVLLTRAVVDFDPTAMRPHPPGYAGLVMLARALPFEPALSLRVVSAGSAVPLVLATWAVARRLGAHALLAGALVAANPIAWMYGLFENAYAAGAAGAACVAWAALVSRERQDLRGAAVLGLVLGVTGALRPSLLVFLGPLALWGAGLRRLHALVAGALLPTLAWLAVSAWASGGLLEYLGAVHHQFTWIREGHPDHWRLHQVHHLAVYTLQACGGAILLLPFVRRVPSWPLLVLWAAVPFGFHLFVYVAKAGYLLPYLPVLAILAALPTVPRALRVAAPLLSAAWFLLPQPINIELDQSPKLAFGEKTWAERLGGEASFFATASLGRLRLQDRANAAYTELLRPAIEPGHTTVVWLDRWDAALADHHLDAVDVIDTRSDEIPVPAEGRRVIVLGWEAPEGFTELRSSEGYAAWVMDLSIEDVPRTVGPVSAVPVY
jgi:hypothetical protein